MEVMHHKALLVTLFAFLVLGVASVPASADYTITDLGTLPEGAFSNAFGINASGQVVGSSHTTTGLHAFLWEDGVMLDLGAFSGGYSEAHGVNAPGQVVGRAYAVSGAAHAFLWEDGVMLDLTPLGGWSCAYGINDVGQVVGYVKNTSEYARAFLWENGVMLDLGTLGGNESCAYGINASGQVVGSADTASGAHAFLWQDGVMQDLGTLGGGMSCAYGINDLGQVVGYASTADGPSHAFLWENGVMRDLGTLDASGLDSWSHAFGISASGQIVGSGSAADGSLNIFLWENGEMYGFNDLIPPGSGWNVSNAHSINDLGQIVGYGSHNGQRRAFFLTPVPEPSMVTTPGIGVWGRYDPANANKPFFNGGWNWWSIPSPPTGDADPASFTGFSLEILRNRLFRWENTTTQLYPDDFTSVEPYHGYVAYLSAPIDEVGYEAQSPIPPTMEIELVPGWNWIGVPVTMPISSVQIRSDQTLEVRTADEDKAMGAGAWLNWNWTFFDSASRTFRLVSLGGGSDDTDLRPWLGYRMMVLGLNLGETYTLIVPSQ